MIRHTRKRASRDTWAGGIPLQPSERGLLPRQALGPTDSFTMTQRAPMRTWNLTFYPKQSAFSGTPSCLWRTRPSVSQTCHLSSRDPARQDESWLPLDSLHLDAANNIWDENSTSVVGGVRRLRPLCFLANEAEQPRLPQRRARGKSKCQ